jgi:hypothetical protein
VLDNTDERLDNVENHLSKMTDLSDLISPKQKPFTTIVDNCQDVNKWSISNKKVTAVDSDCIMWEQSLHCDGQMRSTSNTYDLLNNNLVIKLRINKPIKNGHGIYIRLANKSTQAGAKYCLMKGADTTPFGDWREITIPYTGYISKTENIDFGAIDDVHIFADNIGTAGDPDGTADWNVQFIGTRPRKLDKGVITFTFDDGYKSQYTGAKLLAQKGISSTIYHVVDSTGIGDILSTAELQELVNYYGTDIEVHGDVYENKETGEKGYNALTKDELIEHWTKSQKFLKENGLSEGRHMSYPGNYHNNEVVQLAKKYFDSCRTIQYYIPCESYPPVDHHRLRAVSGVGGIYRTDTEKEENKDNYGLTLGTIKSYIDQAVASGSWLILTFHRVYGELSEVADVSNENRSMYCSKSDLQAIADYAIESGAAIKSMAEVYNTSLGVTSPLESRISALEGDYAQAIDLVGGAG